MANNQAFVNQLQTNNSNEAAPIWQAEKCIGDAPTSNGMIIRKGILNEGYKIVRNGVSFTTNFTGQDRCWGGSITSSFC